MTYWISKGKLKNVKYVLWINVFDVMMIFIEGTIYIRDVEYEF